MFKLIHVPDREGQVGYEVEADSLLGLFSSVVGLMGPEGEAKITYDTSRYVAPMEGEQTLFEAADVAEEPEAVTEPEVPLVEEPVDMTPIPPTPPVAPSVDG